MSAIIGLTGKARSGKTTVAEMFSHSHNYIPVAFGDALKASAYMLNPIVGASDDGTFIRLQDVVNAHGWEEAKDRNPEVRRTLTALGSEAGWHIHGQDLWIRAVQNTIASLDHFHPIVIPDVRFPHEEEWIRSQGGKIIHIIRPNLDSPLTEEAQAHESETADIKADFTIVNGGDLDKLYDIASIYAATLKG